MKKTALCGLIIMTFTMSLEAQIFTPNGTILGTSGNNNVGIGTDNPLANLHIKYANGSPSAFLRLESIDTWQNASTQYVSNGIMRWELGTGISSGTSFELYDRVNNKSSLVIKEGGFVGVGTTAPEALLDVNGKAIVRSSFYVNDIRGFDGGNVTIGPNTGGASSTIFMIGGVDASEVMRINYNKNVGIGTTNPAYKLDVIGTIRSREVKVDLLGADFVFENDYQLMPLHELEKYIKHNKHLPEIAPAKEMQENGASLGELNTKLIQKIEELTLYTIEQEKKINNQAKEIEAFKDLAFRLSKIEQELAKKEN